MTYLNPQRFNVVGTVGASREIGQIELNLIPTVVEPHGHCAYEWLHSRRTLVVARTETTSHVLVVEYLHFECEVLLEVFDDHNEKRQLDAECFFRIGRTCYVRGAHVRAHDLEHQRLDVVVGDTLDVTVSHL